MKHDPDGLSVAQRALVDRVFRAIVFAQTTGSAMDRGFASRRAFNDAHQAACEMLSDAEAAGVPEAVLDATVTAATSQAQDDRS